MALSRKQPRQVARPEDKLPCKYFPQMITKISCFIKHENLP